MKKSKKKFPKKKTKKVNHRDRMSLTSLKESLDGLAACSPLLQLQSAAGSEVEPKYQKIGIDFYFDVKPGYANKGWFQIIFEPSKLPCFTDKDSSFIGRLGPVYNYMTLHVLPQFDIYQTNTDNVTFMTLATVPAYKSGEGIDKFKDHDFGDVECFQPQRRYITPSAKQDWRHIATFDYKELQKRQQQLLTTVYKYAVNGTQYEVSLTEFGAVAVVDPETGLTKVDHTTKFRAHLDYDVPIWLSGSTPWLGRLAEHPDEDFNTGSDPSTRSPPVNKTIFPVVESLISDKRL